MNGENSDSDDCKVVKASSRSDVDAKYYSSKSQKELHLLEAYRIPFDELEEKEYRCTVCREQGNHKQRVSAEDL